MNSDPVLVALYDMALKVVATVGGFYILVHLIEAWIDWFQRRRVSRSQLRKDGGLHQGDTPCPESSGKNRPTAASVRPAR